MCATARCWSTDGFALTATIDILRAIADGEGPRSSLLALGYAGWGPGQLETEIQRQWLADTCRPTRCWCSTATSKHKWTRALAKLGVTPSACAAVGRSRARLSSPSATPAQASRADDLSSESSWRSGPIAASVGAPAKMRRATRASRRRSTAVDMPR